MGWLDKIFGKKKEVRKESVSASALPDWYEQKTKEEIETVKNKIQEFFKEIGERKNAAKENLELLRDTKLKNENIPMRAWQIMQGNRESYIKLVNQFINGINFEGVDYHTLRKFCDGFNEKAKSLAEATRKADQVLNEFMSDEAKAVKKEIQAIVEKVGEIDEQLEKNLKPMNDIKFQIRELEDLKKLRLKQKQDIEEEKKSILESREVLKKADADVSRLEESDEFKEVKSLEGKREGLKNELNQNDYQIRALFLPLEAGLKKYARIAMDNQTWVDRYVESPTKALERDEKFAIIRIVDSLKGSIDNLDLKDQKKAKVMEASSALSKEKLDSLITRRGQLKESLLETEKKLKANRICQDIEEVRYKKEHLETKVKKTEEKIDDLQKKINSSDIMDLRDSIKENIGVVLDMEIEIND